MNLWTRFEPLAGGLDEADLQGERAESACVASNARGETQRYAPHTPLPKAGASSVDPLREALEWTPGPSDQYYRVFLGLAPDSMESVCQDVRQARCELIRGLAFSTKDSWRVESDDEPLATWSGVNTNAASGPTWSFTTHSCSGSWCPTEYEKAWMDYYGQAPQCTPREVCSWAAGNAKNRLVGGDARPVTNGSGAVWSTARNALAGSGGASPPSDTCAAQNTANRACNVVVLHGYIFAGSADARYDPFENLGDAFEAKGYDVDFVDFIGGSCWSTWGSEAHQHGHPGGSAHARFHARKHAAATGCDGTSESYLHDRDSDWRHHAYHLAWYIYDKYSSKGEYVDVAAYSMGGLLIRYALAMAAERGSWDELWPESLLVDSVVTFATPHKGTPNACAAYWHPHRHLLWSLCPDSGAMEDPALGPVVPQGTGGTDWTLITSDVDLVVPWWSAIAMTGAVRVVYYGPNSSSNDAPCDEAPYEGDDYHHFNIFLDDGATSDLCLWWKGRAAAAEDPWYYDWSAPRSIAAATLAAHRTIAEPEDP